MVKRMIGRLYSKTSGNNRLERIWKLAQVDFKKRYYNDKLGILWTFLNPIFQITVFYYVFEYIRTNREENFVFFLYLGLINFQLFGFMSKQGLRIFQKKAYLLENIQFEKIDIFISLAITGIMIATIDFLVYMGIASQYGAIYNSYSFYSIILIILTVLFGLAVAMLLAVIKLYLHDIQNVWSLISFSLFWLSGIFYSGEIILKAFPFFLYLNPMLGILINMRNVFLYGNPINMEYLMINTVQTIFVLSFALSILKKNWSLVAEKS